MRPTKLQNYMDLARTIARRSHDAETQVGAVLVNNKTGAILAVSYNGFVRGADDTALPDKRPDKYPYMMHAEQNIIANCARHGISMEDCSLICTLSPCISCMRLLWQCGITRVVVGEMYKDFENLTKMKDINVEVHNIEGFFELRYRVTD